MRSPRPFRAIVFLLCTIGPAAVALADGKFFRSVTVAEDPTIPSQRAAIIYRDGIETLIVESDIEHAEKEMGWILPLPAPPTAIEPCAPYTLSSLATQVQPEIQTEFGFLLLGCLTLLAVVACFCASHAFRDHATGRKLALTHVALGVLLALLVVSVFLPSLSRAGTLGKSALSDIRVLRSERVGVYDVSVLEAANAVAVTAWLDSNGFAWSPSSEAVIADYIRDGWCFAASKVAADESEASTSHPLAFTFPVTQAVYPMRLTGVDNDSITLDLFVIGKKCADATGMKTWFTDSFLFEDTTPLLDEFTEASPPYAQAREYNARVGAPDITTRMWPGSRLTRLHGRLSPAQMKEDIQIAWFAEGPDRATFFSARAAHMVSGSVAAMALAVLILWFTKRNDRLNWTPKELLRRRSPTALAVACLCYVICYIVLDVVPVAESPHGILQGFFADRLHRNALHNLAEFQPDRRSPERYRELIAQLQFDEKPGPSFGLLREPGDYRINQTDTDWSLTILRRDYVPTTITFPARKASGENSSP